MTDWEKEFDIAYNNYAAAPVKRYSRVKEFIRKLIHQRDGELLKNLEERRAQAERMNVKYYDKHGNGNTWDIAKAIAYKDAIWLVQQQGVTPTEEESR